MIRAGRAYDGSAGNKQEGPYLVWSLSQLHPDLACSKGRGEGIGEGLYRGVGTGMQPGLAPRGCQYLPWLKGQGEDPTPGTRKTCRRGLNPTRPGLEGKVSGDDLHLPPCPPSTLAVTTKQGKLGNGGRRGPTASAWSSLRTEVSRSGEANEEPSSLRAELDR